MPGPAHDVGYLLRGVLPTDYIPQVQGSMYVTGFKSWSFISYNPDMDPLVVQVARDEAYIKLLDSAVTKFLAEMLDRRKKLEKYRRLQ